MYNYKINIKNNFDNENITVKNSHLYKKTNNERHLYIKYVQQIRTIKKSYIRICFSRN